MGMIKLLPCVCGESPKRVVSAHEIKVQCPSCGKYFMFSGTFVTPRIRDEYMDRVVVEWNKSHEWMLKKK